ncbi:MAG: hypothetical protein WDO15_03850 [Bacteroidota bacterium]
MNPIWIIIIVLLALGIYALQGAIRHSFKDVESKTGKARLVRSLLGETGFRYFIGAIGVAFIVAALFATVTLGFGVDIGGDRTDRVEIHIMPDSTSTGSLLTATMPQLKMKYQYMGDAEFQKYQQVSFRNHYMDKLPDLLWKMTNVESIDLSNNDFQELPLQDLAKLTKLKKLVLDGNPIEPAYLEQIRSKLPGVEVIKVDPAEPVKANG